MDIKTKQRLIGFVTILVVIAGILPWATHRHISKNQDNYPVAVENVQFHHLKNSMPSAENQSVKGNIKYDQPVEKNSTDHDATVSEAISQAVIKVEKNAVPPQVTMTKGALESAIPVIRTVKKTEAKSLAVDKKAHVKRTHYTQANVEHKTTATVQAVVEKSDVWSVQVGSFRVKSNAQKLQQNLVKRFKQPIHIFTVDHYHIVTIGWHLSKKVAKQLIAVLMQTMRFEAFLVRTNTYTQTT